MATQTCPACGAEGSGRFCNQCGAPLSGACPSCGAPLPKGARFCNECGASVSAAEGARTAAAGPRDWRQWLPWGVAGAAFLALLLVLVIPRGRSRPEQTVQAAPQPAPFAQPAPGAAAAPAPVGDPSGVDLSSMTPREAADRLFNRVMTAAAQGDTAQARQFLPMAVAAYTRAAPLDADGHYHVALLHLFAGNYPAVRQEATVLLTSSGSHLFGLYTAAQAAEGEGKRDEAVTLYRRFLAAYDSERAKELPEYEEHAQGFDAMRQHAVQATGGI
ncbi:MAG TPA: zinc ribbon domain-containing protein [Longimicrobium sp.]|jgi:hypothetical protein